MRARAAFWEGLASLLAAGIPVRGALASLAPAGGGALGEGIRHLRDAADAGRPLAEAMAERPGAFARFEVALVRAGETAGTLDREARSLAAAAESAERIRRRLASGLAYPLFVLHGVPVPLNVSVLVQHGFAAFAARWLLAVLPIWLLGAAGWWLLREARRGGGAGRILLALPLAGGFLRDAALLRWARAFAALEEAGVLPEPCALQAAAATGFAALEEPLAAPVARLRAGETRAAAFAAAPLPPDLREALSVGEATGTLGAALRNAADLREERLRSRIDGAIALAPAVATVIAGIAVLYAALTILGGAYSLR
jgi:type II secretory pathway component PulF